MLYISRSTRIQEEAEHDSTDEAESGGEHGSDHANESSSETGEQEIGEPPKDGEVLVEPNGNAGSPKESLSPKDAATVEAISQPSVFD